jgi:predicted permease
VARYNEILEKLRSVPGARSATTSAYALLSGWVNSGPASTDGAPLPSGRSPFVVWNIVGPDFLDTMGMRLVLGRGIERRDLQSDRRVAIVNESMAREFFPGENPVGRHFSFGNRYDAAAAYEIIGVAHDARFDRMRGELPRTAYVPYSAVPALLGRLYFEVRTAGDPAALLPAVRQAVRGVEPTLPLIDVKTQSDQIDEALSREHMFARISGFFGLLALLLVAIGVYGTLAYAVTHRTGELGIRLALGARRGQVLWMVLRESGIVIACGLAIGLPAAFALTRFVASMLFGVKTYDAAAIAATVLILAAVGAAAGLIPARRASRIDPMNALRYE